MPCFSNGPNPGTPEFDEWLPEVNTALDRFIHVVDYYFGKAGLPVPQPDNPEDAGGFSSAEELALKAAEPIDPRENARVLQQILLHLDCDEVDTVHLHDLRLLLQADPMSRGHRYRAVLNYCFGAMHSGFSARPTNQAQWRACRDIGLMLDSLRVAASDRKLRLFAVACCRRLPHATEAPQCRRAVEVAEWFADGRADRSELEAAEHDASNAPAAQSADSLAARTVAAEADEAARMTALVATFESDMERKDEEATQADLLRCVLGNPFRPFAFSAEWRTGAAAPLAQQMYETRDFSAMPILADALQDAGCDSDDVLDHCRGPNNHVRGCWVVDLVLGKE